MICDLCIGWAPRSHEQLENRRKNMRASPLVGTFHCPNCDSTDYMICESNIPARSIVRWNWIKSFIEWWKRI